MTKLLLFLLSGYICLTACEKDNPIIDTSSVDTSFVKDFPNKVGDKWIYSWRGGNGAKDTTAVKIVEKRVLLNGKQAAIWQYSVLNIVFDTNYVTITNDTVTFHTIVDTYFDGRKYVFPLNVGKSWGSNSDSTYVISKDTLSVPAGTFRDCFYIKRIIYDGPSRGYEYTWLVNKIGIIKIVRFIGGQGSFFSSEWELISYDVK